ncbi:hypothetical protein [Vampirovibrio sp.]|uniref:hypothetical protein n=1 Tax=Vampirovibrio sp. TaxID=2717857 RepID=UPI003594305A
MPKLEQRTLQRDLSQAESALSDIAIQQGKESPQYRLALRHFGRIWSLLKLTRTQDEFFAEITSPSS